MQKIFRKIYVSVMALLTLATILFITGCSGGATMTALSQADFSALGREMAEIEASDIDLLEAIKISNLSVSHIEFISQLSEEQLSDIVNIDSSDRVVNDMPLGYKLNLLGSLTKEQTQYILNLPDATNRELGALNELVNAQLNFLDNKSKDEQVAFGLKNEYTLPIRMEPAVRNSYNHFFRGYVCEMLASYKNKDTNYGLAVKEYLDSAKQVSGFSAESYYRLGVIHKEMPLQGDALKTAKSGLQLLARPQKGLFKKTDDIMLWVREPSLAGIDGAAVIAEQGDEGVIFYSDKAPNVTLTILDYIYKTGGGKEQVYYNVVKAYIEFFNKVPGGYGPAVALIVLAFLIKLVLTPLTISSTKSMKNTQKLQPLIREMQAKYPDDKQKQAEEQMRLMKELKINPLGGCLPLLIQLPIFVIIYQAINVYVAGFNNAPFLWVNSLAAPDIPLLLLYAASMILTQKLMTAPSEDPQQRMMQNQMTYLMPIFLVFILVSISSGFVLYWFFLNVFSSIHSYILNKAYKTNDKTATEIVVDSSANDKKRGKK